MSTGPKVLAQLEKAIAAHRKSHHATVHEARRHRQRRKDQALPVQPLSTEVPPVEPIGMPAGLPAQDVLSGLYDTGGENG